MRILIAEDDLSSRTLLVGLTKKWGFDPVAVENGELAWEIYQQAPSPRLLLLDWDMPKIDGVELCKLVRQLETDDPPFIIMLTARSETTDIVSGLEAGANEYITKPIENTELKARLNVAQRILALQTEHIERENSLQLAASVFDHAREGITITDPSGNILDVNAAFTEITGYSKEEVIGENPRILKSDQQDTEFYTEMWEALLDKGYWQGEVWNKHKEGDNYAEMLTISAVHDSKGQVQNYIALFSDITAQKRHQKRLEYIAHHDALTNLPNRILLSDRLLQAMRAATRRNQKLAVAYLDLDGFKEVNDTYGHEVGDQLLMELPSRMQSVLREGDTLARLGGDEFIAVLIDLPNIETCKQILHRLLDAIVQPVHIGDLVVKVSASIGVTFYPQSEDLDADQLLRQSDQAMYQAKLTGKNHFHIFDTTQDSSIRGQHESIEHIRRAIKNREFLLFYQPKVNMRSGEIVGVEALIRWQHPERGLLLPAMFLPVLEDHSLSIELGEWVIDSALSQLEAWHAEGLEIAISVNVSAPQLQQVNFIERLCTILDAHPTVNPTDLSLEILETSALEDVAQISHVMRTCSDLGIRFSLDDFGTGYSSLSYLKHLPASELKIDQSFVSDMLEDPDNLAILKGVLGLSVAFRRQSIAEGVETIEHGKMLLQLGCDLGQGYAIAAPMPANNIRQWAENWKPDPVWSTQQAINPGELPVLMASVELRSWIHQVTQYIVGNRNTLPPLDPSQCRLGHWLKSINNWKYGDKTSLDEIKLMHENIHVIANQVLDHMRNDQQPEISQKLELLIVAHDTLLAELERLIDK